MRLCDVPGAGILGHGLEDNRGGNPDRKPEPVKPKRGLPLT